MKRRENKRRRQKTVMKTISFRPSNPTNLRS